MCTVTFIPHFQGLYLGMNRDELLTRPTALSPQINVFQGLVELYPHEPEGGTWIGVNEYGICLALINWHAVREQPIEERVTRGIVIPRLLRSPFLEDVRADLARMQLQDMPPFRLIAVSPRERAVVENRWNGRRLREVFHAWEPQHWFSSGYDEARVQIERSAVCKNAWRQPDAGQLAWLRRLHASHEPERGPFSICMHRREAATVSYTEIDVTRNQATMGYAPGPLCKEMAEEAKNLPVHYEFKTLRLRLIAGLLLSGRVLPRIGNPIDSPGDDVADESDN